MWNIKKSRKLDVSVTFMCVYAYVCVYVCVCMCVRVSMYSFFVDKISSVSSIDNLKG